MRALEVDELVTDDERRLAPLVIRDAAFRRGGKGAEDKRTGRERVETPNSDLDLRKSA